MAHRPPAKTSWVSFFLGSPKRFLITASFVIFALAAIFPDAAQKMISNALRAITSAVMPYASEILYIVIAVGGIWILVIQPFMPKKKKKGGKH